MSSATCVSAVSGSLRSPRTSRPLLPGPEEVEHSLNEEGGGGRVVRRQRAVGEIVLVARVEEQLCILGLVNKLAGGVNVALETEEGVSVHPVDLDREAVRPRPDRPLAGDRQTRLVEKGAPRTSALSMTMAFPSECTPFVFS